MASAKFVDEAAVLAMLKAGATPLEVASALSVSEGHARRLRSRHNLDTPAIRQRHAQIIAEARVRGREIMAALNAVQVPVWVKRAGLESDFRDTARDFGEDAALRHCRRLTAEMRRLVA